MINVIASWTPNLWSWSMISFKRKRWSSTVISRGTTICTPNKRHQIATHNWMTINTKKKHRGAYRTLRITFARSCTPPTTTSISSWIYNYSRRVKWAPYWIRCRSTISKGYRRVLHIPFIIIVDVINSMDALLEAKADSINRLTIETITKEKRISTDIN